MEPPEDVVATHLIGTAHVVSVEYGDRQRRDKLALLQSREGVLPRLLGGTHGPDIIIGHCGAFAPDTESPDVRGLHFSGRRMQRLSPKASPEGYLIHTTKPTFSF